MGTYFKYINAPTESINVDNFFPEIEIIKERCICGSGFWPGKWNHQSNVFTDSFRSWLEEHGCRILKAEAFRVFPQTSLAWHNDTNDDPDLDDLDSNSTAKINFMWGDNKNCVMEYGDLKNPPVGRSIVMNRRGRRAWVYDPTEMKIIESFKLDNPVLINRGQVHRVTNNSNEDWVCLSCIIENSKTQKPLAFSDALEIFSKHCF